MTKIPVLCVVLLWVTAFAGCGAQTYDDRLEHTKKWYAYRERVETNLSADWNTFGMTLRVPMQFVPIPAPVVPKGTDPKEVPDLREPDYMKLKLNDWGLQGTWEARFEVPLDASGRVLDKRKGYIHLLNNQSRLASQSPEIQKKALDYEKDLMLAFFDEFEVPEDAQLRRMVSERHPLGVSFVPGADYLVANIKPRSLIDQVPYRVDVYYQKAKNVQTFLILVLPEGISPSEQIKERTDLMLENFTVTGDQMRPGSSKQMIPSGPNPF